MHEKRGFASLVLVFLFAAAIIVIFVFTSTSMFQPQSKESQIANNQNESTANDDWDIPELPSGFDWQRKNVDKPEATAYKMYWSSNGTNNSFGDIQFPTTLYFIDLNYEDPKEILDYHEPINKFDKEMENNGWKYDVMFGNKRIMGMTADGVFFSIYGTVKVKDSYIRSVGYSYNMKPTSWEGPESEVVCPCHVHLEIFVGDEVSLESI